MPAILFNFTQEILMRHNFLPGLSYGAYTGSLAYPLRFRGAPTYQQPMLVCVLDLVHPGQFNALPPDPAVIAGKGVMMGLGTFSEFYR
jgi:hypothetical protein